MSYNLFFFLLYFLVLTYTEVEQDPGVDLSQISIQVGEKDGKKEARATPFLGYVIPGFLCCLS